MRRLAFELAGAIALGFAITLALRATVLATPEPVLGPQLDCQTIETGAVTNRALGTHVYRDGTTVRYCVPADTASQ